MTESMPRDRTFSATSAGEGPFTGDDPDPFDILERAGFQRTLLIQPVVQVGHEFAR